MGLPEEFMRPVPTRPETVHVSVWLLAGTDRGRRKAVESSVCRRTAMKLHVFPEKPRRSSRRIEQRRSRVYLCSCCFSVDSSSRRPRRPGSNSSSSSIPSSLPIDTKFDFDLFNVERRGACSSVATAREARRSHRRRRRRREARGAGRRWDLLS